MTRETNELVRQPCRKIETYAASLGIEAPEVDVTNFWRDGTGCVHIEGGIQSWASMGYQIPRGASGESLHPVVKAGRAADHLLQVISTKN